MKFTIENNGVDSSDAITIFAHYADGTSENVVTLQAGEKFSQDWDGETRYEVVPWYKFPKA